MTLVRGIDSHKAKQSIVAGMMLTCRGMGVRVVGEGVETAMELHTLVGLGLQYFQGYLFATLGLECLPDDDRAAART